MLLNQSAHQGNSSRDTCTGAASRACLPYPSAKFEQPLAVVASGGGVPLQVCNLLGKVRPRVQFWPSLLEDSCQCHGVVTAEKAESIWCLLTMHRNVRADYWPSKRKCILQTCIPALKSGWLYHHRCSTD